MTDDEATSYLEPVVKSDSEPELCNGHSVDSISDPAHVIGDTNPLDCMKKDVSGQGALQP